MKLTTKLSIKLHNSNQLAYPCDFTALASAAALHLFTPYGVQNPERPTLPPMEVTA